MQIKWLVGKKGVFFPEDRQTLSQDWTFTGLQWSKINNILMCIIHLTYRLTFREELHTIAWYISSSSQLLSQYYNASQARKMITIKTDILKKPLYFRKDFPILHSEGEKVWKCSSKIWYKLYFSWVRGYITCLLFHSC